VGAGRSQEAPFDLADDIKAGSWHLVADGVVVEAVDVHFEVALRRAGTDTTIVSWDHHFEPATALQALDLDAPGTAVTAQDGDQIVFKYTGQSATRTSAYIPNGEGKLAGGRDPSITLP
jgi:hypothetical protein